MGPDASSRSRRGKLENGNDIRRSDQSGYITRYQHGEGVAVAERGASADRPWADVWTICGLGRRQRAAYPSVAVGDG